MKPKYNKKLNFLNEKKRPSPNNNLSKYRKLYRIDHEKLNANTSDNQITIRKEKEKIQKLKSLFGVYKNKNADEKQKNKWENLTKPKLPFSQRTILPKDVRKKKIESLKPSSLFHNNHVIHWIRSKYSSSVIEKSLYTILPEKDKTKEPEKENETRKRQRKMMEYLESFREPTGREKYVKINPKYFYDSATFKKIKHLKDIFLEFDKDGSRKMSIDELTKLFNENNINANEDDIVKLFFENKSYKKKDYFKLNLNFYQFLKFALNKGQDFRLFMRKIKAKLEEENKKNKDNQDKNIYLPMNLNLLLDYFILKSKEKSHIEKIEKVIEKIDQVIKKIESSDDKKNSNYYSSKNISKKQIKSKKEKSDNENSNTNSNKDNILDDSLENLDFRKLIDEFSSLFTLNKLDNIENPEKKAINDKTEFKTTSKKIISNQKMEMVKKKDFSKFNDIKKNILSNMEFEKKDLPIYYEYSKNSKDAIGNTLKKMMNQTTVIKLNFDNYKKYHNIQLALDKTKEEVEQMKSNNLQHSNLNYRFKKYYNKNNSLKSFPLVEKKFGNPINNNVKKSFLFKYKNMSKNNSMKLFTRKELMNYNKNYISNESRNSISNYRRTNKSAYKFSESKSSNILDKKNEKFDYYSDRKFDYVPNDLFSIK